MEAVSAGDPTVTLYVAIISGLALIVGPALVALINRGGRSASVELDPDKVMPRAEYNALLEQMARLDDENDRLVRENARLREAETVRRIEDDRRIEDERRSRE